MAKSAKPAIIEEIFFERYDAVTGTLDDDTVTLNDVAAAITSINARTQKQLSTGNVANFFKDLIRNLTRANANWPQRVFECGYAGRQETGANACFRFIRVGEGETRPFPSIIVPDENAERVRVESVSIPLAARRLGRPDETWLMQVLARLRVIETHFCLFSATNFQQIDHLQTGVQLGRKSQIDAVYLARRDEMERGSLLCCEAKGLRDDILTDQLIRQVRALFAQKIVPDKIIPVAAKVTGPSLVHVVEFHPVRREDASELQVLTVASQAVYEFVPPIPGIGSPPRQHRKRRKPTDANDTFV